MAHGSPDFQNSSNSSIFIRIGGMGYDDANTLQLYMAVAYYPIRNEMLPQFLGRDARLHKWTCFSTKDFVGISCHLA
jgi:hypothetical protein